MDDNIIGDVDSGSSEARQAYRKAEVLREFGKTEEGLDCYREAADADSSFIPAHLRIIELLPEKDRVSLAPEVRDAAARVFVFGLNEQIWKTVKLLGDEGSEIVEQEVINNYRTWVEICPDDYDARYQLTCFLERSGNSDSFREELVELAKAFPDRFEAYVTLYYHYLGTDEAEAENVRQAIIDQFGEEMAENLIDIDRLQREFTGGGVDDFATPTEEEPITEEDIQQLIETMKEYGINLTPEEAEELMRREPTDEEIEEGENG